MGITVHTSGRIEIDTRNCDACRLPVVTRSLPVSELAPPDRDEVAALRAIVEGTAGHTGDEFFRALVSRLSAATGVPNAFIAEFAGSNTRVRTLAYWTAGGFTQNAEWELPGTP